MSADPIPVICALARRHVGDHDEAPARAVRESRRCGAVVRVIDALPPALAEEDEMQERAERDGLLSEAEADGVRDAFHDGEEPLRGSPEELGNEGEPVASAVAGEGGCSCPPGARAAFVYSRTCPEHGDDRPGQAIVLPPDEGGFVAYPLLGAAILDLLAASLAGLSFFAILAKFPGADPTEVSRVLAALLEEGRVSRYMSDDEPPQPIYIEAAPLYAPDPSPASPSPADLTASVLSTYATWQGAIHAVAKAHEAHHRSMDAKARDMHARGTALAIIGGVTYRPKAPRKKRGAEADAGALWTLERVEVEG